MWEESYRECINLKDLIERETGCVTAFLKGDLEPVYQKILRLELERLESVRRILRQQ